jgi:ABC-type arginine/histidine transport system permease subunit
VGPRVSLDRCRKSGLQRPYLFRTIFIPLAKNAILSPLLNSIIFYYRKATCLLTIYIILGL